MKLNTSHEPVRLYALVAGLLTSSGGSLVAIGEGVDPLVAIGTAIVSFGVVVGGGELARSKAYAPASYDAQVRGFTEALDQIASAEDALSDVTIDDIPDDAP